MEPRSGTVVNGAIVLDGAADLAEGEHVIVWVRDTADDIDLSDDEIELVDAGRVSAGRERLLDARSFLRHASRLGAPEL